jgi:hypothetical protein
MGVLEEIEKRDVINYVKKVADKVTGGEDTADGEELTDNMKTPIAPPLSIQQHNSDLTKQKMDKPSSSQSDKPHKNKKQS